MTVERKRRIWVRWVWPCVVDDMVKMGCDARLAEEIARQYEERKDEGGRATLVLELTDDEYRMLLQVYDSVRAKELGRS